MTFQKLILRHESFRTFFETLDKEPVQKIKEEVDFKVDYFEQGTESPEERISKFIRPFDLSVAPLIRVGLMELSADEHLLVLDAHHIVMDAVSLLVFLDALVQPVVHVVESRLKLLEGLGIGNLLDGLLCREGGRSVIVLDVLSLYQTQDIVQATEEVTDEVHVVLRIDRLEARLFVVCLESLQ